MLTPHDVHYGLAEQRLAERARVLLAAHAAHPERFPNGVPTPGALPGAVWINKPRECGCEEDSEVVSCPGSNDLGPPTGDRIRESVVIRPTKKEMLLVGAH